MNSEDSKMVKLIDENITNCEDNINTNNYNNGNSNDVKLVQNDADHNQNEGKKENDNNLEDGKKTLKKFCFIELNEGISLFNLLSYYAVQFTYVCAFTFIDACQDYLLEDEKYYNIDKNKVGTINGDILFFDLLYLILFIHIYGSFHDVFGSKFLIVFGFISMGISLILYPMAGKIYPNLILVRLIFSNGICAVTTQPLLADYVNHRSKGFGGGIAAVVSGLGAIFAALFLLKLQSYIEISKVYWVSAVICFTVALICAFGVKNVKRATIEKGSILNRLKQLFVKLKEGFKDCRNNYPLCIGIATNSLARMNTLLITLFLIMWIKQHDITQEESVHYGHMISGIGNSLGLISALLFGFLFVKQRVSNFLLITNALVAIGYVSFYLSPSVHHWLTIVSICCASFGFYGMMTLGYVIVNLHCGHKARGSIMGINCLIGAIFLMILAKLGGLAFDKIDKSVPFLFVGGCSAILFFIILFTRSKIDVPPNHFIQGQDHHKGHHQITNSGEIITTISDVVTDIITDNDKI